MKVTGSLLQMFRKWEVIKRKLKIAKETQWEVKIITARKNIASGEKQEETAEPSLCSVFALFISRIAIFFAHLSNFWMCGTG